MNLKVKSSLIIIITLIVGILIGAFGHSAIISKRMGDLRGMLKEGGFTQHALKVVDPVDENQASEITEIMQQHEARMRALSDNLRIRRRALSDSLKIDLSTVLDESQMERLSKMIERGPPNRNGRRPGPPGRRKGPRPDGFDGPPPGDFGPPPEGLRRQAPPPDSLNN